MQTVFYSSIFEAVDPQAPEQAQNLTIQPQNVTIQQPGEAPPPESPAPETPEAAPNNAPPPAPEEAPPEEEPPEEFEGVKKYILFTKVQELKHYLDTSMVESDELIYILEILLNFFDLFSYDQIVNILDYVTDEISKLARKK
jgi:hypothetical protein